MMIAQAMSEAMDVAFPARLKSARERRGLLQEELGVRAGLDRMTINRYEAGKQRPSKRSVRNLAEALQVPHEWLRFGVGQAPNFSNPGLVGKSPTMARISTAVSIVLYIRPPQPNIGGAEQGEVGEVPVPEWIAAKIGEPVQDLCGWRVEGDAMTPTMTEDDTAVFVRADRVSRDGVYVYEDGDHYKCRRAERLSAEQVALIADNKRYERRIVADADLRVVGRVVWVLSGGPPK